MVTIVFLLAFVTAANASDPDWETYKARFHRKFDDPDEENMRHGLFNGLYTF